MIRNFTDGDIVTHGTQFATSKEATKQAIIRRLRLFLGEYFLNVTEGTPWFQSILGKTSLDIAAASVKERIITAPGVLGLTKFEFKTDMQTRKITIYASLIDINNEQFEFLFNEELV
ncbi:hypothetical protein GPY51_22030 [Photorhabdus laumondii subsp. laumondii]|uniref:Uncharacterized protein n=1 Tax=Photorhabdus laumondii subsp. laumondii TaxID=141679 RepID=A0A6L9JT81_PHOLM|nr:hypothetical protein [Photorhabdus laumondii]MCC8385329.1 hypothetical protein [Photorhabdus laumondii]MCC8414077.1 hypothetical protein [Photorhabdus laumondii]NDK96988.1 hypothetical protein [Photorhabdus laumondii subsp. laumondii]NDL23201.1 hypothetical protein [Photorhabdus laumondii subsp. laumondii]NDL32182.1 hypothetical protein [Photorhabdus laumondii subsp. laumondii]